MMRNGSGATVLFDFVELGRTAGAYELSEMIRGEEEARKSGSSHVEYLNVKKKRSST